MSQGLYLSYTDLATPTLRRLIEGMTDRSRLNAFVAGRAETVTRNYLQQIARTRHATALRLGGKPTGHLERAAESVSSHSDASGATISITSPGISRVSGPVTITAKNKYLTIPATGAAYGKRAEEVSRIFGALRFIPFRNGTKALGITRGKGAERRTTVFYWLKPSVTLPQDRTLLPSDQTYALALEAGAKDYFSALMAANN